MLKINEFLDMSRNMVVEYCKHYNKDTKNTITEDDISFLEVTDTDKILGSVMVVNKDYNVKYVVDYDINNKKIKSYVDKIQTVK